MKKAISIILFLFASSFILHHSAIAGSNGWATKNSGNGAISGNATDGYTLPGSLTAGGTYSKLTLQNNAADNTTNEYGIFIYNKKPFWKQGTVKAPLFGYNNSSSTVQAALQMSDTNPVLTIFGEELYYPLIFNDTIKDDNVISDLATYGGDEFTAYKWLCDHSSECADDVEPWNTSGMSSATFFTASDTGSPTQSVIHDGYLVNTTVYGASHANTAHVLRYTIPDAAITRIEITGKMSCKGTTITTSGGNVHAYIGFAVASAAPLSSVGIQSVLSGGGGATNYTVQAGGTAADSGIDFATPDYITYRMVAFNNGTSVTARTYINGSLVAENTNYTTVLLSDQQLYLDFKTRANTNVEATPVLTSYGFTISWGTN
jgi:hypothetical protein